MIIKIKTGVFKNTDLKTIIKTKKSNYSDSIFFLENEFNNLKKAYEFKTNSKIRFPKPYDYNKKEGSFSMEYVDGILLNNCFKPTIFRDFGRNLSILNDEGLIHAHLELQDAIYKNGYFYLVDLMILNHESATEDYSRFKISIHLWQLKRFWNWIQYDKISEAFTKGYGLDKKTERERLEYTLNLICKIYFSRNFINKLKGLIIYYFIRYKLLRK